MTINKCWQYLYHWKVSANVPEQLASRPLALIDVNPPVFMTLKEREFPGEKQRLKRPEISSAFRAYDTLILELSIIYKCYLISATSALLGFCVSPHSQRLTTHTHGWEPNHCHGKWFWIKGVERASNPLYNMVSWWLKLMPQDLSIRSSLEYGNET